MPILIILISVIIVVFWLVQLLDVMFQDEEFFESHNHKLSWFLVIFVGNIIGAIWYYTWKYKCVKKNLENRHQEEMKSLAETVRIQQNAASLDKSDKS